MLEVVVKNFAIATGITAGIVQLHGYWVYNSHVRKGHIIPNGASWFIWGIGSLIAFFIYFDLTHDLIKSTLPFLCSLAAFVTFVFFAIRGHLSKPDSFEIYILILDFCVVVFWLTTGNPRLASLFLQIDVIISFIPIIRSTLIDPSSEKPGAWKIWTLAYLLLTVTVLIRWESWWELLFPINYLLLHALIWRLSLRKKIPNPLNTNLISDKINI